jgi:hypothetical protein
MPDTKVLAFKEHWINELESVRSEINAIAQKYPEASSAVKQVYDVLSVSTVGCTSVNVGQSAE